MALLTSKFTDTRAAEAYVYAQGRVDGGDSDISPLLFSVWYMNRIKELERAGNTKRWPSIKASYNAYVKQERETKAEKKAS